MKGLLLIAPNETFLLDMSNGCLQGLAVMISYYKI
jgi:hypothetical protein